MNKQDAAVVEAIKEAIAKLDIHAAEGHHVMSDEAMDATAECLNDIRAAIKQSLAQPQAPVVPEGFVPSMNETDRERIDWCVRTLHDGYKILGRDKPMGDFYPAVISVVGALKRTLEPNMAEPEPSQRDEREERLLWSLRQIAQLDGNFSVGTAIFMANEAINACAASKGKS